MFGGLISSVLGGLGGIFGGGSSNPVQPAPPPPPPPKDNSMMMILGVVGVGILALVMSMKR